VFIDGNKLIERWNISQEFTIAELGFGTSLNFLETWHLWQTTRIPGQQLNFISFEAHPLESRAIVKAISNWPTLTPLVKELRSFWDERDNAPGPWQIDAQTSLQVYHADAFFGVSNWQDKADAWYLDGFSPAKNPKMWSLELMQQVFSHTKSNGTFATYTAAGWVRRNLQAAGFTVNRIAGHGKKRHMSVGSRSA
jgi:tRNA U34 5-methylaminomethyl-2-thiouridine-forming methyltransferase MnmC